MIAATVRLFVQRRFVRRQRAAGKTSGSTAGKTARPAGRHVSPIRVIRRPAAATVLVCGVLAAAAAAAGLALASHTGRAATPAGTPSALPAPSGLAAAPPGPVTAARVPAPVRLIIPAIGVRTRLVGLGLTAAGTLQAPRSPSVAGWYTGGPPPGAVGPAVIAGHIDSLAGPGIFFRLRLLRPGDRVYVRRADGSLAVFTVTSVRSYPKSKFPTEATYGPVPTAQLRLVTCGGTFDPATGSYLRDVIAYAVLTR